MRELVVPYPLQNHLRYLPREIGDAALRDLEQAGGASTTLREWLLASFGKTLFDLFFGPFHSLYTAGLDGDIAPQDGYKSPIDIDAVRRGVSGESGTIGYNTRFLYPEAGLNDLVSRMARQCDVRCGRHAVRIDLSRKCVYFASGEAAPYDRILSTLPLNKTMELAKLQTRQQPPPYTSVLVLNVGAAKGPRCPDEHWLYIPGSRSGFHRVGFYSNVESSFLPRPPVGEPNRVSMYVERAYANGARPDEREIARYSSAVVEELQGWGFVGDVDVVDPTWIDVAYTWSYPGSTWEAEAQCLLSRHAVFPIGRYGRWVFQGIADSIRDGFVAGGALKS